MRVLVTGASGMLGRDLTARLLAYAEVTGISKSGKNQTLSCDLSKKEEVSNLFKRSSFQLVIHTAAFSDVDGCERDPKLAHESNALATKYLAQRCAKENTPFIYVSTDYVFDGKKKTPYLETDATCPVNIYGMTKLEGEYYAATLPSHSAIVRTSWLFGEGNSLNFVNAMAERLKSENCVQVLNDQEDSPTFVGDLSEALQKIGAHLLDSAKKNPKKQLHEIFHVCNHGSTTRYDMTLKIREYLGLKDVKVERLDKSAIKNRLAIRPEYAVMSTKRYEGFFKTKIPHWRDALKNYLSKEAACVS